MVERRHPGAVTAHHPVRQQPRPARLQPDRDRALHARGHAIHQRRAAAAPARRLKGEDDRRLLAAGWRVAPQQQGRGGVRLWPEQAGVLGAGHPPIRRRSLERQASGLVNSPKLAPGVTGEPRGSRRLLD